MGHGCGGTCSPFHHEVRGDVGRSSSIVDTWDEMALTNMAKAAATRGLARAARKQGQGVRRAAATRAGAEPGDYATGA